MDRSEAIELLKPFRNCMVDQYGCPISDVVFALDLAIEALSDTPTNPPTNTPTCNQTCNKKQVASKLENADDSLLTEELETCKEQKSKLDCISRQQAIEALIGWQTEPLDEDIVRTLENLPTITPTERTGEWIKNDEYVCDQCGYHMIVGGGAYNFCPNCGADMRGEKE